MQIASFAFVAGNQIRESVPTARKVSDGIYRISPGGGRRLRCELSYFTIHNHLPFLKVSFPPRQKQHRYLLRISYPQAYPQALYKDDSED
jgi:hypothetical protein